MTELSTNPTDDQRTRVLEAIRRALEPLGEVRAAMLFGSRATKTERPQSDVDVAVLLDFERAPRECGARLRTLIAALSRELAADRLDVIVLNDAPPALAFQVLKYGVVAFERDPRDLLRFRVRVYGAHADYAHVERFFREVTKARALAGLKHG